MKKYLLSIDPATYKEFRRCAKEEGRSMRWLIERFMRQYTQERKRTKTGKSGKKTHLT